MIKPCSKCECEIGETQDIYCQDCMNDALDEIEELKKKLGMVKDAMRAKREGI